MTNKKKFKLFEGYCWFWIAKLGLGDWRVHLRHRKLAADVRANVDFNVPQHSVVITLNKHCGRPSAEQLNRYALHEVLHIALLDLCYLGALREYDVDAANRVEHAFIVRVENMLLGAPK